MMKKIIYTMLILLTSLMTGKANDKLPSLCDEWNVAEMIEYPKDHMYQTFKWRLTTDTVINAQRYVKIEKNHRYEGALREDDDANIYFVHPNSTKEFLLYAFHAQVGDTLTNTYLGNKIIVKDICPTTPRTFVLDVEYGWYDGNETYTDYWTVVWIEGIGYSVGTPTHYAYALGSIHSLDPDEVIICAYKNGEQVYMSDFAEIHGCDYYLQDDTHEAIYNVPVSQSSATKLLRDGQLIIRHGKTIYNAQGVLIK